MLLKRYFLTFHQPVNWSFILQFTNVAPNTYQALEQSVTLPFIGTFQQRLSEKWNSSEISLDFNTDWFSSQFHITLAEVKVNSSHLKAKLTQNSTPVCLKRWKSPFVRKWYFYKGFATFERVHLDSWHPSLSNQLMLIPKRHCSLVSLDVYQLSEKLLQVWLETSSKLDIKRTILLWFWHISALLTFS